MTSCWNCSPETGVNVRIMSAFSNINDQSPRLDLKELRKQTGTRSAHPFLPPGQPRQLADPEEATTRRKRPCKRAIPRLYLSAETAAADHGIVSRSKFLS